MLEDGFEKRHQRSEELVGLVEQSRPRSERKFKDNFLDRWRKQDLARSNSAASSRENSDKCKLMVCEETERRKRLHAEAIEQTKS